MNKDAMLVMGRSMAGNVSKDQLVSGQDALAQSHEGGSRSTAVCSAIMAVTSLSWFLMTVVGAIASYAGSRVGAMALLNAWLLWPLGAIACGTAALFLRDKG